MTTIVKIIIGVLALLLIVATASSLYQWYKKPTGSTTTYVKVPEIKEVIKIKRVSVPGPERIVTIEKKVIVEKLQLPVWIAADADEQAIATAVIEPYKGNTNAIGLINTKTGVGQIVAKQEPLSMFGFVNDKEIGVRAGYSAKQGQEIDVYARWDFVRVGNVNVGVYGEATSYGEAKAMVSAGYRF
jgi:hypothetical protein